MAGRGRMKEWALKVDPKIDYQGVVNAVFLLKRGLTDYYWVAAMDEDVPYQGIVESSVLLEKPDTGGHHLVYLMNYMHRTDPRFAADDDDTATEYTAGLKKMFPGFREDDIVDRFVFRDPFVEPLYSLGYLGKKPPEELVPRRVYMATSAQVYPAVTSWNSSVGFARRVAARIV
jgi:protoporphyrinogen oxidase